MKKYYWLKVIKMSFKENTLNTVIFWSLILKLICNIIEDKWININDIKENKLNKACKLKCKYEQENTN